VTRFGRARHEGESGVVLVLVAGAMVVLIGMMAIAIDASYGFVQNRRAQNASDFAAFAAAQALGDSESCAGSNPPPTVGQIVTIMQNLVTSNDSDIGTAWTGEFLDAQGNSIGSISPSDSSDTSPVPFGACGVSASSNPSWPPFFAQVFGIHELKGFATAKVGPRSTPQTPIGIVALNKVGPHEILGGGTGTFVVGGDIILNTDVQNQPWTDSGIDPTTGVTWEWDDGIDAKTSSNLYVYGTIHSSNGTYNGDSLWPLDGCFRPEVLGNGDPPSSSQVQYSAGDPNGAGSTPPSQQMSCNANGGSVIVDFDNIDPTNSQINDPLQASGAPPDPLNSGTDIACPGSSTATYSTLPAATNGVVDLEPGIYTSPVAVTGNANFEACANGYPGIYRFTQGLWIDPGAGDSVTGTNVVIGTQNPYPLAGNVPGSLSGTTFTATGAGNGAPCLPSGTMSSAPSGGGTPAAETDSSAPCSGTSPTTYGVVAYHDAPVSQDTSMSGTGNNFSLIVGGASGSSVSFTGPTSGAYGGTGGNPGLAFYQDPGTQANDGFDAEAGDAATITINGVVYNASLSDYGADSPQDYWDGTVGGIPFYAGGTLQSGYGTGWSNGPAESGGSVTITGSAIVDDFNTDGNTDCTIIGQPYSLSGTSNLSLIG
jgi:hypothetical protein